MCLFGRKRKDDEQVDPNERSPQLGIKNKDLAVLGMMMDDGADLSQPRHVLYYLYFESRDQAVEAATIGQASGYSCSVQEPTPEYPDQWALLCERADAVLDPPTVIAADNLFQGIADRLGGEFDGWEASMSPGDRRTPA